MLSEKVEKALNDQFNAELYSSYLYLSMNAYFKSTNLDGFANWMYQQAIGEMIHAMKFYDFINQRGGRVTPAAIAAPPSEWESPLAVFEDTLSHE
jgi:ferritin